MRTDPSRHARMSDPDLNPNFTRQWSERPMSSAELECLSDLAASVGHWRRADMLSRQAAALRGEVVR